MIAQLEETAKATVAAPVASTAPTGPRTSSVSKTWKARIKGTPEHDPNPQPSITELTPPQRAHVLAAMKAVVDGREPLTLFEINWKALNARAKADENGLQIVGFEAYADLGLRSKPGARR